MQSYLYSRVIFIHKVILDELDGERTLAHASSSHHHQLILRHVCRCRPQHDTAGERKDGVKKQKHQSVFKIRPLKKNNIEFQLRKGSEKAFQCHCVICDMWYRQHSRWYHYCLLAKKKKKKAAFYMGLSRFSVGVEVETLKRGM